MERFLTRPESIKTRIRRNQRRAITVGIFYWVAIFALFCLSIFPYVAGLNGFPEKMNGELWIITFMEPITTLLSGSAMTSDVLIPALLAIFYIFTVVASFICAISATAKLIRITKKNPTIKWGYNRAAISMKLMAKRFAFMFFMMLTLTVIGVFALDGKPTLFFYIAFGIAALTHFVANFRRVKVSYFESTADRFNPIERRSKVKRGASLIRNAWQLISIIAIVLLADAYGSCMPFFGILDGGELALIPAILFGVLVFLIPAIAHATSTKEYNGFAKKKKGRATCRVSAVMIALLGLAGAILTVVSPTSEDATMMPLIGIFAVAFVWFIVEQIFAAKAAKDEKKDVDPFEQAEARTKRIKKGRKAKKENKEKIKKEKAEKRKAKKEEKVNQIVEEPKVVEEVMDEGLSAEIVALRDRWLNMEVESIPEEKPASNGKLLESQQVNCPNCKTIVDVPFGCTKVTCTNCETVFKMKKRLLK